MWSWILLNGNLSRQKTGAHRASRLWVGSCGSCVVAIGWTGALAGGILMPIAPAFAQSIGAQSVGAQSGAQSIVAQSIVAQSTGVFATMKPARTLTVSGRGTESIQTTIAVVRLGVEEQGKTAEAVQKRVAQRSNSLVTLLKSRGVEKLETTGINLTPVYNYNSGSQPVLTGYQASNSVSFQVSNAQAGSVIDEAVQAGASRIDGISFIATPEATAAAQKRALRLATQEAQAQAQAVLATLNFTPKEVIGIQVGPAIAPPRVFPLEASTLMRAKADAPTPVMGGEQTVEATVTLEISY